MGTPASELLQLRIRKTDKKSQPLFNSQLFKELYLDISVLHFFLKYKLRHQSGLLHWGKVIYSDSQFC